MRKPQGSYDPHGVIPIDRYINDLERALSDAEWDEDDTETQFLRKRIEYAKLSKDCGEDYYVPW